jgi:hypothetical protein
VRRNPAAGQFLPTFIIAPKTFGHAILFGASLPVLALCMAAGLLACIASEAFDEDLGQRQAGAEDLALVLGDLPMTGSPSGGSTSAAIVPFHLVMTAGERLAVRSRARSALGADAPISPLAQSVAEPRRRHLRAAPALGHLVLRGARGGGTMTGTWPGGGEGKPRLLSSTDPFLLRLR